MSGIKFVLTTIVCSMATCIVLEWRCIDLDSRNAGAKHNGLPTPIKLLKNLATLEHEAVSAVYRFNSTIGRTKRLVHNLKLQGKVNRSDVCGNISRRKYATGLE